MFCTDCSCSATPCFGCGAPLRCGPDDADGYVLCTACRAVAVSDALRAAQILVQTRTLLARQLGLRIAGPIGLRMVEAAELQQIGRQAAAAGGQIIGLYRQKGEQRTILVRAGLPLIVLRATLAHELAHAWQAAVCRRELPTLRAEGHAEWVAYHVLRLLGAARAAERLRGAYLPYARELAALLQLEARGGAAAVERLMVDGHARPLA